MWFGCAPDQVRGEAAGQAPCPGCRAPVLSQAARSLIPCQGRYLPPPPHPPKHTAPHPIGASNQRQQPNKTLPKQKAPSPGSLQSHTLNESACKVLITAKPSLQICTRDSGWFPLDPSPSDSHYFDPRYSTESGVCDPAAGLGWGLPPRPRLPATSFTLAVRKAIDACLSVIIQRLESRRSLRSRSLRWQRSYSPASPPNSSLAAWGGALLVLAARLLSRRRRCGMLAVCFGGKQA